MPEGKRPPVPPLHAKVELKGTIFGHATRNICYLAVAGSGIGNADMNAIASGLRTAWDARFKAVQTADASIVEIKITYIPAVGEEIVGLNTTAVTGTLAGTTVTDAAASYLVNWNVNRYYRGGKPRWYIPGVLSTAVSAGSSVDSTRRTALTTGANGFINDVNALTSTNVTSVTLGTLSFQHDKAWRATPVFWQFMTGSAGLYLVTQRRRIRS